MSIQLNPEPKLGTWSLRSAPPLASFTSPIYPSLIRYSGKVLPVDDSYAQDQAVYHSEAGGNDCFIASIATRQSCLLTYLVISADIRGIIIRWPTEIHLLPGIVVISLDLARMAHQSHSLPWQTLADNFKFVHTNARYHGRTNLYPCFKHGQGNQLQHFARVFATLLNDFSTQERAKYPAFYTPPESDEVFISDASVSRIAKTVKEYKAHSWLYGDIHRPEDLALRPEERRIQFWITNIQDGSRYPPQSVHEMLELLKTLLLWGEMDPLFRLAAHSDVWLPRVWSIETYADHGWADVKNLALTAYICLNVLYLKPELYDATMREEKMKDLKKRNEAIPSPEQFDYRLTSSYQETLVRCTWVRGCDNFDVCTYPHREFYGAPRGTYTQAPWNQREQFGRVHPSYLIEHKFQNKYVPGKHDIPIVINLLGRKGLPAELALLVLDFANYTPQRRLLVPDDPLHPENGEQLRKYLSYCWNLLVRTDMLLKANGSWIDWEYEVTDVIHQLWGVPYPKMSTTVHSFEYKGRMEHEVDPHRTRRIFVRPMFK
ncbi:uncharacterized protein BDR25DRAFT_319960 [Lindgomyces ingoldianus]|uniref:Uncharacterized protein n=1 Tax=Lindgomyces ingoldianus TaxID=673940 RepID=A0ACB6QAM7_9PLEO|nr:uncharacterized protein BDR25DRAFT_319960 [Lindgomyces ingoldianus]KAF2463437.1 hypothetical protein BDR25DRAFT_319960 [Lindgomyces ingoldianus]